MTKLLHPEAVIFPSLDNGVTYLWKVNECPPLPFPKIQDYCLKELIMCHLNEAIHFLKTISLLKPHMAISLLHSNQFVIHNNLGYHTHLQITGDGLFT